MLIGLSRAASSVLAVARAIVLDGVLCFLIARRGDLHRWQHGDLRRTRDAERDNGIG